MDKSVEALELKVCIEHTKADTEYISYQVFGQALHTAPIVLVNHALTGNSEVAGKNGWWSQIVGEGKVIDLDVYTVIAFDIPGNGYLNKTSPLDFDYKAYTTKDIAGLFWKALDLLKVTDLYAIIGGSLGGAIAWEMSILRPKSIQHLIPIATGVKASDWLIGNVQVQESLLNQEDRPIENARMHAMLLYRTPESLNHKFSNTYIKEEDQYAVESWLSYHGEALSKRYTLLAYKRMNYLLRSIGESLTEQHFKEYLLACSAQIHCIGVNSDYMFSYLEQENTYNEIKKYKQEVSLYKIDSIHGHDAFLMEYDQLQQILNKVF